MKTLIEEFVEKALATKEPFSIQPKEDDTFHFLQDKVGNARYIYEMDSYGNGEKCFAALDLKPELVAIISEGKVYIVDHLLFGLTANQNDKLPENTEFFLDFKKQVNNHIKEDIFKPFYKELEEIEPIYEDKYAARKALLTLNPVTLDSEVDCGSMFDDYEIAQVLCGFIDTDKEAKKCLDEKRDSWVNKKATITKQKKLTEEKSGIEDWELDMVEKLRSVKEANAVTVELELNGKTASGKIEPGQLVWKLRNKDCFSCFDFVTRNHGKEVLNALGIQNIYINVLTCKNITKITYRKKEIYVRK